MPGHGPVEADWIAAAPAGEGARTAATYATAVTARANWARANRVAHGWVMGTLPEELQEDCAQRPSVVALWRYLEERFAAQSLTSTAALWVRLFNVRLSDYSGVSNFLTALTKLELELVRAGMNVPQSLLAGAILVGIGDRFPTTKELLLTLPQVEQTKAVFEARLLEAEKNAKVTADLDAITMAAMQAAPPTPLAPPGPPPASANPATRGTGQPRHPCTYVRKYPGKGGSMLQAEVH